MAHNGHRRASGALSDVREDFDPALVCQHEKAPLSLDFEVPMRMFARYPSSSPMTSCIFNVFQVF